MNETRRIVWMMISIFAGVAAVFTPAAAIEGSVPLFTAAIEVRAMTIEAVVTDRDGVRISGLEADDFRLIVDGEEVPIDYFTEVRDGTVIAAEKGLPESAGVGEAGANLLIFIDEFFALDRDKKTVLRALAERVPQLRDNDRVAIVAWDGRKLTVLTDWTASKTEVSAALEAAMKRPGLGLQRKSERQRYGVTTGRSDIARAAGARSRDPYNLHTEERLYADLLVSQLQGVVGAAMGSMIGLERPSGRKAMLILSGGWPMDVVNFVGRSPTRAISDARLPGSAQLYAPLANSANLLGYTLYPVDMPGLLQRSGGDVGPRGSDPFAMSSIEFQMENELHDSLRYLAWQTGGLPLINAGRISALSELGADIRSFYWVSFTPTWERDDRFREVRLEVIDPELQVRSMRGFPDLAPETIVARAVETSLLFGPIETGGELQAEVIEVEKAKRRLFDVTIKVTIPMAQVAVVSTPDGYVSRSALYVAALDKAGGRSDVVSYPLIYISKEEPEAIDALTYEATLRLRKNTERVTIALHDQIGGGFLTTAIEKKD